MGKQYRIGGPQARYKTIRETLVETARAPFRRLAAVARGQASTTSTLFADRRAERRHPFEEENL